MWAIVDVLGDAVTPEVAAAWDEVYWLMANALINQERGLYSARGVRAGDGVAGLGRSEKKIPETADVVTFVVKRIDDRLVKTSLPGQYVTRTDADARRCAPAAPVQPHRADDGEHRQFSVKRVHGAGKPDGEVSTLLYDTVAGRRRAHHVAALSATSCSTTPGARSCSPAPAIGITPMAGMLSHLAAAGSGLQIMVLHADVHEGIRSRCAGRSSATSSRCPTRRCTSGTRRAPAATSRSTGCTPGMMDLVRRRACPTTPGTTCAARSRSCRRCAAR